MIKPYKRKTHLIFLIKQSSLQATTFALKQNIPLPVLALLLQSRTTGSDVKSHDCSAKDPHLLIVKAG